MELRSTLAWLHDRIGADGPQSSWWRRGLWYLVELGPLTYQKTQDDKAPQMAAALTYHTLFSLLPTLVLSLVVAKSFVTERQLQDLKVEVVGWTLQWLQTPADQPAPDAPPSARNALDAVEAAVETLPGAGADEVVDELTEAATQDAPAETPGGAPAAAPAPSPMGSFFAAARLAAERAQERAHAELAAETGERLKEEFNETAAKLDQTLQDGLDRLQNISLASIGTAGVLFFIYGATTLLSTIEDSFNFILRSPGGRPWYLRLPMYYFTLTVAPLVLVGAQVAQRELFSILEGDYTGWIVPLAAGLTPLLAIWAVLFALYKLLPSGSLALIPALIGSFVASIALVVTTSLFGIYVSRAGTTSLYGALAILPFFLLLLWIVWQIVLFGLELASVIRVLPAHRAATAWGRTDPLQARSELPDPRLLLPVAAELASRFTEGKPVTARGLADRFSLPTDTLQVLLERLVSRGDAHRLPGEDPGYTLARPPSAIGLDSLLDESFKLGRQGTDERAGAVLAGLDDAARRAVEGRSLADLLPGAGAGAEAGAPPPSPPLPQPLPRPDAAEAGGEPEPEPGDGPTPPPDPATPRARRFRLGRPRRRPAEADAPAPAPAARTEAAPPGGGGHAAKGE